MSGSQGGYSQSGGPQSFNGGLDTSGRSATAYGGGMAPANTYKPPSAGPAAWGGLPGYNINPPPPPKMWTQDERMQPQQAGTSNVYNPSNPLQGSFGSSEMPQRFNAASEMPQKMTTAAGGGGYGMSGGPQSFGPRNMSAAVNPAQAMQGMGAYGLPQWLTQRFAPQQPAQGGGGQGYGMDYPAGGIPGWKPPPPITTPPSNGGGITPPTQPPTNNQGIAGAFAQAQGAGNTTGIQQLLNGGMSQQAINQGFQDQQANNMAGSNAAAMDEYRKSIGYKGPTQWW